MKVKCVNGFKGCLTKNKEYEILSIYNQYVLVEEDNSRLVWSFISNFEPFDINLITNRIEFKVNWNII